MSASPVKESGTVKGPRFEALCPVESRRDKMLASDYWGTPLIGIFPGDAEPIDAILGRTERVFLCAALETIGESPCYVIDARTDEADYTLWIDPQHGYQLA